MGIFLKRTQRCTWCQGRGVLHVYVHGRKGAVVNRAMSCGQCKGSGRVEVR